MCRGKIALVHNGIIENHAEPCEAQWQRGYEFDSETDTEVIVNHIHKEIHEQPRAIADTLQGRVTDTRLLEECFGPEAGDVFKQIQAVQIIACGTSYHAGLVARHWFESIAGIPCRVDVASEFRCRRLVAEPQTLVIAK